MTDKWVGEWHSFVRCFTALRAIYTRSKIQSKHKDMKWADGEICCKAALRDCVGTVGETPYAENAEHGQLHRICIFFKKEAAIYLNLYLTIHSHSFSHWPSHFYLENIHRCWRLCPVENVLTFTKLTLKTSSTNIRVSLLPITAITIHLCMSSKIPNITHGSVFSHSRSWNTRVPKGGWCTTLNRALAALLSLVSRWRKRCPKFALYGARGQSGNTTSY